MALARKEVKAANPDVSFGTYTGAWYPSYYEVGVNFASKKYDPSEDFDWATSEYKNYGYAELMDLYTTGNYYTDITIEESLKNKKSVWNETDSQAQSGTWYSVEGSCQKLRNIMKDNKFMGGILVDQFYDNPAKLSATIEMNLKASDGLMVFDDTKLLKSRKMVDGFCYYDEIRDVIKKQLGLKTDEKICQVSMSDVNAAVDDSNLLGDQIAVYYCQGEIVRVATPGAFGSEQQIVSNDVIQDLQDLGNDKNIKAVVLRINSGGGDAYASEQIWRAVSQLNKKKPVVVSMGGMAASGAYYMSMGASYIMAQPTTLTGSIGIFGALPDISDLMTKKLGFKYDEVKTNRNSAYGSAGSARPWSAEEIGHLQAYVNRGYALFRQRVANGRKMKTEEVEKIAQGRVWLGTDAKSIKLIDGFGCLDDAVAKAAQLAKVSDYGTTEYPMPADWIDQLLDGLSGSGGNYLDEQLRLTLGDLYQPFMMIRNIKEKEPVQAAMPFVLNIH